MSRNNTGPLRYNISCSSLLHACTEHAKPHAVVHQTRQRVGYTPALVSQAVDIRISRQVDLLTWTPSCAYGYYGPQGDCGVERGVHCTSDQNDAWSTQCPRAEAAVGISLAQVFAAFTPQPPACTTTRCIETHSMVSTFQALATSGERGGDRSHRTRQATCLLTGQHGESYGWTRKRRRAPGTGCNANKPTPGCTMAALSATASACVLLLVFVVRVRDDCGSSL
ncbi:hypothetical protein BDU57DRAFT_524871 [Ampelomyces quisqualis]|uniref:Uncharacterized protein n=1 Tax=Ampelomyces quisqualis TaxID=50730 RepID=A0A6A5Q6G6_AMPQU|nr:hypothetical protein BDU57DRAFT_524871 [Ampelomyces quisqualis]